MEPAPTEVLYHLSLIATPLNTSRTGTHPAGHTPPSTLAFRAVLFPPPKSRSSQWRHVLTHYRRHIPLNSLKNAHRNLLKIPLEVPNLSNSKVQMGFPEMFTMFPVKGDIIKTFNTSINGNPNKCFIYWLNSI